MPKINRALTWIRKALDVTQKTAAPTGFDDDVRTILDAFGWERLNETIGQRVQSAPNANFVIGSTVPDDVLRLVLEASVEHNDPVAAHTLWLEHRHLASGRNISIQQPVLTPGGAVDIVAGLMRSVVMRPGDTLTGRSAPATGAGNNLIINQEFVELPIGEYVRSI